MTDILRAVLREVDKRSFLEPFFQCGSRSDGRGFEDCRDISAAQGTHSVWVAGSCTARCGGTAAVCTVSLQTGEPAVTSGPGTDESARALEGDIEFMCGISPVCGLRYDRIKDNQCYVVESGLEDVFIRSGALSLEQLGLPEFGRAYKLIVQVTFLSVAGSLLDAAVVAVRGALHNTRLPVVTAVEGNACVASGSDSRGITLRRDPILLTCGILDNRQLLVDPSLEELEVCSGQISIAFDENGKVCFMKQDASSGRGADYHSGASEDLLIEAFSLCSRKTTQVRTSLSAQKT